MTAYKLRCHKCDDAEYPDAGALIDHLRATHDDLYDLPDEYYDTPLDACSHLQSLDVLSDALLFSANAEIERMDDALHSAFQDWLDDFPDDSPMDYDAWLACHITCLLYTSDAADE